MTTNPFKKLEENKNASIDEKEFVANATGETNTKERRKTKTIHILESLAKRLDFYTETKATRKESQNYIINEAIGEWLDKRGC